MAYDITFQRKLHGNLMTFHTTYGIFSPKEIDYGSFLLLKYIGGLKPDANVLDIGCGYGALGLTIAKLIPKGSVDLVDKDFVAIEYANINAKANNLSNATAYLSNGLSHVPHDKTFQLIVSNIPAKVGNEMLERIFTDAYEQLEPGGKIIIVCIAGLRKYIKRVFNDIFGNYEKLDQKKNYSVCMAIKN